MKELEDHWRLLSEMIEEEQSGFEAFLNILKKKSERLDQYPYNFLWTDEGNTPEEQRI